MVQSFTSPVVFAHRGASSHAPENTLASFQLAVDQGARAIELDVQLTKDQEVVVFHDIHLDRITDGSGKVKDRTLKEIKQLNAAVSFHPGYQNQKIPTLAEVFDALSDDVLINVELKNLNVPLSDLPSKTAAIIRACNAQNHVLISSFNSIALWKFRREMPSIPCGRLMQSSLVANIHSSIPNALPNIQSIHLPYHSLHPQMIASYKRAGKMIYSYTLNHTADILSAMRMGIDGFFTDDPGFAIRILIQNGYLEK